MRYIKLPRIRRKATSNALQRLRGIYDGLTCTIVGRGIRRIFYNLYGELYDIILHFIV